MTTFDMEERRCPKCGYKFEAATSLGHNNCPKPGDVTFCIECNAILLFAERLTLRTPSELELCEIKASGHWEKFERARRAMRTIRLAMRSVQASGYPVS
jgi:hypothetical protein